MKIVVNVFTASLALLTACCASIPAPTQVQLRETTLRLEFTDGVCSGTAIDVNRILSAKHCFNSELILVNGQPVTVKGIEEGESDTVVVTISGVAFGRVAPLGPPPAQGDRLRWWGNPNGASNLYRQGYVSGEINGNIVIDATICFGDSGSGLFNDAGQVVGVVSAMTNEYGCTFMAGVR